MCRVFKLEHPSKAANSELENMKAGQMQEYAKRRRRALERYSSEYTLPHCGYACDGNTTEEEEAKDEVDASYAGRNH